MKKHIGTALAVLFVLAVYAFFGSAGTFEFRRVTWEAAKGRPGQGYYHSLAEGFLRGQLSLADRPDPRLLALPHPYDGYARHVSGARSLWDASYLNGRYYLYFTPLPVLLFYIPFRLVAGLYPSDALAATFFCAWTFLMAAAFLRRALREQTLHVPLPLWIVLLGLGNLLPFFLPEPKVYENAIFVGTAMSMTWAYALLRFLESPTRARALFAALWLALAIAARPNLMVLLVVMAIALFRKPRGVIAAALVALIAIGAAVAFYNVARFGDPFEYGQRYQLTFISMADQPICGVCNFPEVVRIVNSATHYLFWAPAFSSKFPFVDLRPSVLDPAVSFPAGGEQIVGLAPLVPLALLGSVFAALLALRGGRASRPPLTGILPGSDEASGKMPDASGRDARPPLAVAQLLILGAWLVLLALTTCWWVTGRYALDFMLLMTAGAIVCIEHGLSLLATAGIRLGVLRAAVIVLALYTIIVASLLGFRGVAGGFERVNPDFKFTLSERQRVEWVIGAATRNEPRATHVGSLCVAAPLTRSTRCTRSG